MTAAERATQERKAQGRPTHVEDDGLLDRVAGWLAEYEHTDGGGPSASRRRRRVEEPSTTKRAARKAGGAGGPA
jgi:hypothetical protein